MGVAAAATSPLGLPCVTFLDQETGAARRPQGPSEPSRAAAPAQRRHAGHTRTQLPGRSAPALPVPAGSCSSKAYGGCEGTQGCKSALGTTTPRSSEAPAAKDGRTYSFVIGSSSVKRGWAEPLFGRQWAVFGRIQNLDFFFCKLNRIIIRTAFYDLEIS